MGSQTSFLITFLITQLLFLPSTRLSTAAGNVASVRDVVCSAEEGVAELPKFVNALCMHREVLWVAGVMNRAGAPGPNASRAPNATATVFNFASYHPSEGQSTLSP